MTNPQIPLGGPSFVGTLGGRDSSVSPAQLSSLTLSISDYTTAYVAASPGSNSGTDKGFQVVPKLQTLVGVRTVTITASARDQNGNTLPLQTFAVDIMGTPAPNPAVSLQFTATPGVGTFPLNPDPGTATATLI